MKNLVILKIGGSVITDKHSKVPKVNYHNLNRIAKEISAGYKKMRLVLVTGAGSYGHQIVSRTGIDKGISTKRQLIDFAETQRLQNELNVIVTKALIKEGLPAIPCQASASAIMLKGRLREMGIKTIKGLLDIGMIPVLYGVPAYDKAQKCSILSGDQIAPYLAKKLGAKKIIHTTNVNGVFTADPTKDKSAKLIPEITKRNFKKVKKYLAGASTVDVTGGMAGKVSEILKVGIESQIISALVPGNITKALKGEKIGTAIKVSK